MKTKLILAGILACIGMSAQAQTAKVEEPEITADWFEIANTKLTQADNLNINTTPIKNGVQIDTTSKNGETTTTTIQPVLTKKYLEARKPKRV